MITREAVHACIHPATFKYYLDREAVLKTWQQLARRYHPPKTVPGFGVVEIRTRRLLIRASRMLNPLTLIRLRGCDEDDVHEFHRIIGFEDETHERS